MAAKQLAINNGGRHNQHHVAWLVRGKSVIRLATNSRKTHPAAFHRRGEGTEAVVCRSMHAEHSALVRARPGDVLYVARYSVYGEVRNSKPCPECEAKIRAAGLKRVYYTDAAGQWQRLR